MRKIQNILVAGDFEKEFSCYLPNALNQNLRFLSLEKITATDLLWADAYVGFAPCPGFDPKHFQWVHTFNAGVNNFLMYEGWGSGTIFTRTVCSFGERISEYCLSYLLQDLQLQRIFERNQHEKIWHRITPRMLKDETVVVFGTGEIGQVVAKTLSFFGTTVYGVSRSGTQVPFFKKVLRVTDVHEVLKDASWVIGTLPLTPETESFFNEEIFSHMQQAGFINVGRGVTVNDDALLVALDQGRVRHAVLDVFAEEPLPRSSVYWNRKDVTITPHISAVTELKEAIECFSDTLRKIELGKPLHNQVDLHKGY